MAALSWIVKSTDDLSGKEWKKIKDPSIWW
jgi:hypothetical protein